MVRTNVHRLPAEHYLGRKAVAFTTCLVHRTRYFESLEQIEPHLQILQEECARESAIAYGYCFMPDHLHVVLLGTSEVSNVLAAFQKFKRRSGHALRNSGAAWQPRFYDHVLRPNEDTLRQVLYVFNNPVRAGLCSDYRDYELCGSIGISFDDVLVSIMDL